MTSITTDYVLDKGNPAPFLRRIAEAGFSHVHWCHHWNDDYLYADVEVQRIGTWLCEFGLKLNDLHAAAGIEKYWLSPAEHMRLAGVELVKNRMHMTAQLGGDVIVIHVPPEPSEAQAKAQFWKQLRKSLDELEPFAKSRNVRIAIENLVRDNFDTIESVLAQYAPEYLGLCYDSGHANIATARLHRLERLKDRLIALHLNDNDGSADQHMLPFQGSVDWPHLAQIIADSSYNKCVSLEVQIYHSGIEDEAPFLEQALLSGTALAQMIEGSK